MGFVCSTTKKQRQLQNGFFCSTTKMSIAEWDLIVVLQKKVNCSMCFLQYYKNVNCKMGFVCSTTKESQMQNGMFCSITKMSTAEWDFCSTTNKSTAE